MAVYFDSSLSICIWTLMPKAGLYEHSVFITMSGFLLLHWLEKKDLIAEDSLKLRNYSNGGGNKNQIFASFCISVYRFCLFYI